MSTSHSRPRPPAEFTNVRPVFRRLGISDGVGYQMIKDGTFPIPVVQFGKVFKCRIRDVDAFIEGDGQPT